MGQQIIKQPNGKFALWSSVVDDFLFLNATPEEIIEFRVQQFRKQTGQEINQIILELNQNKKPYFQFTQSWEECLETVQDLHGKQKTERIKTKCKKETKITK